MSVRLDGKVMLVTGATAGVGRAIATAAGERGARVVGTGRRHDAGQDTTDDLRRRGTEFTFVQGDVTRSEDCERAVATCIERYGRVDALINNVGTSDPINPVEQISDEDWDTVVAPTLNGVLRMCRATLPMMQTQRGGVIINISSVGGVQALANLGAYGAAKAAIMQLSRSIAVENVGFGVRSNSVVLGFIGGTDQTTRVAIEMGRQLHGPDWVPDASLNPGPLGKGMIDPEAVGRAIALLCSDDAREINGTTIRIDRAFTSGFLATSMFYLGLSGELPDVAGREFGNAPS